LGGLLIVKVSGWVPVPLPLVALRLMLYMLTAVGMPEIKPVVVLKLKPGGMGVAPQRVIG
jgi:hypothetical protein